MEQRELVIIGAGPAGLSAAIYGKRAGLDVLVLEKGTAGGQICNTSEIENWPGTLHTSGEALAACFRQHAEHLAAEFRSCLVRAVKVEDGQHVVRTDAGDFSAKAVLLATGASFRHLGCKGEKEFLGKGVSFCAVCDANLFEGLDVAVIGGGNTAVEEACYLSQFAEKVYIVHRRDTFRADQVLIARAQKNPKIVPVWESVVEEIYGDGLVEGLRLAHVKTGAVRSLALNGVFVFVGTVPNASFMEGVVDMGEGGWISTDADMRTSVAGIFAAGDVRDTHLRQVITAAADGARAAMSAWAHIRQ